MIEVGPEYGFEMAALTDVGTVRDHNEDHCAVFLENAACGVALVADGVSGSEGGETASRMAVEVSLRAFREHPPSLGPMRRLTRSVQQANIEVHELSLFVPELRGMATTLTAAVIDRGELTAAHVGDSRLYLSRGGTITQLTKDHTVAAEQNRLGLLSDERARRHPGKAMLTRSLGRELICAIDRIALPLLQGDALLLCSDGLHGVLEDSELESLMRGANAESACRALIDAARVRGAPDNLTAAVVRMTGPIPAATRPAGLTDRLRQLVGLRSP